MYIVNLLGYIDPASTALIWQILAGVFISLAVVFAIWWKKIITFFKGIWVKITRKEKKDTDDSVTQEIDEELSDDIEQVDEELSDK
ncbi:MAG: hypothetical protein FWE45_02900 [Firmicutes bacterium]|nr:hypothetical protein [Bacillota bacterium]